MHNIFETLDWILLLIAFIKLIQPAILMIALYKYKIYNKGSSLPCSCPVCAPVLHCLFCFLRLVCIFFHLLFVFVIICYVVLCYFFMSSLCLICISFLNDNRVISFVLGSSYIRRSYCRGWDPTGGGEIRRVADTCPDWHVQPSW